MKKITLVVVIGTLMLGTFSCSKSKKLSAEEIEDLTYLREEEKLARDVYLYAYDKYGEIIFKNISDSEQKHMDKVLDLLNEYDLPDPAKTDRGQFKNKELQGLYNNLTTQANISLIEALKAGATIEDLDIRDIDLSLSRADRSDILDTYQKLNCGSRNHMRAFTNALTEQGAVYTLQFISQADYDVIINSENEKCGQ